MVLKKIAEKDFVVSDWSGGKTRQIAIHPPLAVYADRDFHFRVSSASVELEESVFTPLPDYERIIAPISGRMTLCFPERNECVVLNEMEFYRFDGAWNTTSKGQVIDFNLMLRKNVCTGDAFALTLPTGEPITLPADSLNTSCRSVLLIWCVQGTVQVITAMEALTLASEEAVQIDLESSCSLPAVQLKQGNGTQAKLIVCRVHFS